MFVFGRPGGDLLSQVLRHSTIGAEAFDGRVRDGIGSGHFARATRPAKDKQFPWADLGLWISKQTWIFQTPSSAHQLDPKSLATFRADAMMRWALINESDQANRAISTGKLHTLLRFHTRPIDVVVFHGSQGSTRFEAGFPLRCIQRLSLPYIATLHCGWRHNRSTRGMFTPVLSY